MSNKIYAEITLAHGVDPATFDMAFRTACHTNPAIKDVHTDCDEDSDWTEEELAHLVTLGPESTSVSVEETRHLYLRISAHLKIPVKRQELVIFEFLSVSPVIMGQKQFHKQISAFRSAIFREVVFEDSNPKILTAVYSKLRAKLENTTSELIAKRGRYGFKAVDRPDRGKHARARPKDTSGLLDPRVPLDKAVEGLFDDEE